MGRYLFYQNVTWEAGLKHVLPFSCMVNVLGPYNLMLVPENWKAYNYNPFPAIVWFVFIMLVAHNVLILWLSMYQMHLYEKDLRKAFENVDRTLLPFALYDKTDKKNIWFSIFVSMLIIIWWNILYMQLQNTLCRRCLLVFANRRWCSQKLQLRLNHRSPGCRFNCILWVWINQGKQYMGHIRLHSIECGRYSPVHMC